MSTKQAVKYRLARTVVRLDGSLSIDTGDDGLPRFTRTCQISLGCEADPAGDLQVSIDDSFDEKRTFDIKLADDGHLTGAADSLTGLGAEVISSVVTVAAAAAKVASGLTLFLAAGPETGAGATTGGVKTIEQQYHDAHEQNANQRTELASAVANCDEALSSLVASIASADTVTRADQDKLTALEAAVTALRAELAAAETQFQTWKTATFPTQKITVSYLIGVEDLPRIPSAVVTKTFSEADLAGQADSAALLGIAVAVVEPDSILRESGEIESHADAKLFYRRPRRAQVAAYSLAEEEQTQAVELQGQSLTLSQLAPAWIIDKYSETGCVELTHGWLRSRSTTLAFSDSGTLNELGNQETPPVDALTKAIGAAGSQATTALDDVSKISAAFAPSDPATAALQAQVTEKELQVRLLAANAAIAKANAGTKAASV